MCPLKLVGSPGLEPVTKGLTVTLTTTLLLGACSSTPVSPVTIVGTPVFFAPAVVAPTVVVTPAAKPALPAPFVPTPIAPCLDPASLLFQKRSHYFDFDQANVKPDYTPLQELY